MSGLLVLFFYLPFEKENEFIDYGAKVMSVLIYSFVLDFIRNIVKNKILNIGEKSFSCQICINILFTLFCLPICIPPSFLFRKFPVKGNEAPKLNFEFAPECFSFSLRKKFEMSKSWNFRLGFFKINVQSAEKFDSFNLFAAKVYQSSPPDKNFFLKLISETE